MNINFDMVTTMFALRVGSFALPIPNTEIPNDQMLESLYSDWWNALATIPRARNGNKTSLNYVRNSQSEYKPCNNV